MNSINVIYHLPFLGYYKKIAQQLVIIKNITIIKKRKKKIEIPKKCLRLNLKPIVWKPIKTDFTVLLKAPFLCLFGLGWKLKVMNVFSAQYTKLKKEQEKSMSHLNPTQIS